MSLYISVNKLAEMKQLDEEGFAHYQQVFGHLNQVLQNNGLPTYREPVEPIAEKSRAPLTSFPYAWIHYLHWVQMQILKDPCAPLKTVDSSDELMAILEEIDYMDFLDDPLIGHSDSQGFYLPVDFDDGLLVDTEMDEKLVDYDIDSSYQLMSVLKGMASPLGIQLDNGQLSDPEIARLSKIIDSRQDFYREIAVWLGLFEASRLSIKHQTAVVFD